MNLFVFGPGYTALQFIRTYRNRFACVSGTFRSAMKAASLQNEGIVPYFFDAEEYDPDLLDEITTADALLISIPPATGLDPVLRTLSDAIASASRLRWIGYLSTIGVYGDADGGWVDETTPPNPANERSRERLTAEEQWLAIGDKTSIAIQIFRLAGIYGPGRNALAQVANGTARRIIKPGQVFNRIHSADIAQVLMASLERPSPGAIYNITDDEPAPPQDVITYAAHLLGFDPPPGIPFADADLSPMARSFYQDNKRVRNDRMKNDLGVRLRFPTYREGLEALHASGEGRHS
ncbi:SDR family oxidoreductase [Microvirga solisilvae]|uniref:SDR family oxidoreductase n=1 Tax=Microvirga solisilvae TaxID=2919498 RepID=UPI001FAEB7DA|nr:SDR family oxidoreductase [Microvirga solisilvae]